MKKIKPAFLIGQQSGVTFIELMAAMAVVVIAAGGLTYSLSFLRTALRKSEAANLMVNVESTLVSSFNNSNNYPDDPAPLRADLRAGSISSISLSFPFATAAATMTIPVGGTNSGFLNANLAPCTDFKDLSCWLKYSIGFRKVVGTSYPTYAFSYEIEVNPAISQMKKIGNLTEFDVPIDPANYRLGDAKTKCDASTSMFMIGMNRDTGEALCVENPKTPCAVGTYPVGLRMSGTTVEMGCTPKAKTAVCPDNYSLNSFDPKMTDPRCPSALGCPGGPNGIGTCVWTSANQWNFPNPFPPSGLKQRAKGSVCPPFYFTNTSNATCTWRRGPNHKNGTCYSTVDNRDHNSATCYNTCYDAPCSPPSPLPVPPAPPWIDPKNCPRSCNPYKCWDGSAKLIASKGLFYSGNPVSTPPIDPAIHFSGDGKRELDCSHDAPLPPTLQPCQPGAGGDIDKINIPAVWDSGIVMDGMCKLDPAVTLVQPATAQ